MVSFGMLRRVALVRNDVSEELSASFIRVVFLRSVRRLLVTASVAPSSPILVTILLNRKYPLGTCSKQASPTDNPFEYLEVIHSSSALVVVIFYSSQQVHICSFLNNIPSICQFSIHVKL
jgi:hypothetical protein